MLSDIELQVSGRPAPLGTRTSQLKCQFADRVVAARQIADPAAVMAVRHPRWPVRRHLFVRRRPDFERLG